MVNDNFQPSIPTGSSKGVIFQRRSSVIREVPRVDTTAAKKEGEDENDDESQTSQESGGPSTRTWRTRRKIRRDYRVDKKCANDDEWRPLDKKRHKCSHCSMKFKKPSALVIHMRTHSGERPYKCKQCSKRFSISGNLRRHMFTHTGEKPYKCQACGRAFNNPSHLARHSKKIHI